MRLAVFDNLPEGGAKRVVFEQVKRLAPQHSILYITNMDTSVFPFDGLPIEIRRFDLTLQKYGGFQRPLRELSLFTQLLPMYGKVSDTIKTFKPDVVLIHPCRETQAPFLLSLLHDYPTVYFGQEWLRVVYEPELHPLPDSPLSMAYEWTRRRVVQFIDATNVRSARKIVVNSQFTAGNFKKAYGRTVVSDLLGVDGTFFKPDNKTTKRGYFLFVGEKEAINGYPLLQSALSQTDLPFKIVYVEFARGGFKHSDEDMRTLYQQAAATLCLGVREPFGLSALESMACGTPVIAVNEGGYTETVVNGQTGFLINRSAQQLADTMKRVATDTESMQIMRKKARAHALTHFNWNTHVGILEKILDEVQR